jgi:hypothetical protein
LFLKESKIKMDVITYLLFVFTLIIFIRTWKIQVEKTMKTKSESWRSVKNIYKEKKFEYTLSQVENSHDKN